MPTRVQINGPKHGKHLLLVEIVNSDGTRNKQAASSPIVIGHEEAREFYVGDGKALLITEHGAIIPDDSSPAVAKAITRFHKALAKKPDSGPYDTNSPLNRTTLIDAPAKPKAKAKR